MGIASEGYDIYTVPPGICQILQGGIREKRCEEEEENVKEEKERI